MSDNVVEFRSMSNAERMQFMRNAFEVIEGYKRQQKDIGEAIKEAKDAACIRLNIAPKAFDLTAKYWSMTPGERIDLDTALTLAQQALDDSGTDDMFIHSNGKKGREPA